MSAVARNVIAGGVVLAMLFAAFAVETAARLMAEVFVQFGADLPTPTILTLDAVKSYVPWIVAAASAAAILFLWVRGSGWLLHACAALAGVITFLVSCAMVALVLPIMKCGFSWPDWPAAVTEPGKPTATPGAGRKGEPSRHGSEVPCR